ncbi:MAG: FtsX-like permease family protein [Acetatifactor sp.]|nr:FtsX-like permease family protein [Acetatifactor sp.]
MTRFLVSENDYKLFDDPDKTMFYSLSVYTEDEDYVEKVNQFDLKAAVNVDYATIKMVYVMDTLIAAVILVVSICLILISMVILRFTIHFTLSEEFREIGVMKAIGIPDGKIRGLYIVKYLSISAAGAAAGLILSVPFGNLLIKSVSNNIIISGGNRFYLNVVFAAVTAAVVVLFCYFCTGKVKKFSPIDAIRNGETGERYTRKGILRLSRSALAPAPFMALNDILSGIKRYLSMILIFTIGLLLIIIPVNTINTLQSERLLTFFNMAECDHVITQELLFSSNGRNKDMIDENLDAVRRVLQDHQIEADIFQEIMFRFTVSKGDKKSSSLAFQGTGQVTAEQYSYLEGTPPQNGNEVALSYVTAGKIGAEIGDEVEISMGDEIRRYTVCAINQSMNNMGEGIHFYQGEDIDYNLAAGSFGVQISYRDNPDRGSLEERKELLKEAFPEDEVYTAGEYISYMIGNVAEQIEGVKKLILGIILCVNILVSVLMVKSFLTKERGEIAMLKAMGFHNSSLVAWQSLRIGIVLLVSVLIGIAVSTPLSRLTVSPIFRMMGAYSIAFEIVPLEVYVIYPLILLAATVLAAAAGALQLRKISVSETSGVG